MDQMFALIELDEKSENIEIVYIGFTELEKEYDKFNRKALWQV